MGLMRNTEWNQPPPLRHANCRKEAHMLVGSSVLPTHTGTRASVACVRLRHRLAYAQWFHTTSWRCEPVTFLWKVPCTHRRWQHPISHSASWLPPFAHPASFWGNGERTLPFQPFWLIASVLNISCYCEVQAACTNDRIMLVYAMAICSGRLLAGTETTHSTARVTPNQARSSGKCSAAARNVSAGLFSFFKKDGQK